MDSQRDLSFQRKTEVYVATGKRMTVKLPDYMIPIRVGAALAQGDLSSYLQDNTGDNISALNRDYCELTAMYWAWKNSGADIKGLCHYRRFFSVETKPSMFQVLYTGKELVSYALEEEDIRKILSEYDMILLMPYDPGVRTGREDLLLYVSQKELDLMTEVIERNFSFYRVAYHEVLSSRHLSYCNMLMAKRDLFDRYSAFLFSVLQLVEGLVEETCPEGHTGRLYGYLGEILLNVFVRAHGLKTKYVALLMEKTQLSRRSDRIFAELSGLFRREPLSLLYTWYVRLRYPSHYRAYRELCTMLGDGADGQAGQEKDRVG